MLRQKLCECTCSGNSRGKKNLIFKWDIKSIKSYVKLSIYMYIIVNNNINYRTILPPAEDGHTMFDIVE